ncbi:MAG: DUF4190 domain-containing protein [Leucobacter sp.]
MQPPADYYASQPVPTRPPGKILGIVGLVLAFFVSLVGLILSIVALVQSRRAGVGNVPAVIGIVVGAIGTVVWTFVVIALVNLFNAGFDVVEQCFNGAETIEVYGQTMQCAELLDDPEIQQQLDQLNQ